MACRCISDLFFESHLVKVSGSSIGASHGNQEKHPCTQLCWSSVVWFLGTRHHMLGAPAELRMDQCCT